jgi:hypothetical protein
MLNCVGCVCSVDESVDECIFHVGFVPFFAVVTYTELVVPLVEYIVDWIFDLISCLLFRCHSRSCNLL